MITADWVEARVQRMFDRVTSMVYSIARYTTVAKASADGQNDKVKGQPSEPGEPDVDDDVRRFGSGGWGLAAVPPAGEPCLVVRAGGGPLNGVLVACGSKRYIPANMEGGDVVLYSTAAGLQLYLKASDGSFTLTDKAGAKVSADGSGSFTLTDKAGAKVSADGAGNVTVEAAAPNGSVTVTATPVTGAVKLGPVGIHPVLVQGSFDSLGVPVTQYPEAILTIVKSG